MTVKTKGLKKGTLEFLLSSAGLNDAAQSTQADSDKDSSVINPTTNSVLRDKSITNGLLIVPIEKIQRSPYQPRKTFAPANLQELAESIKAKGLIQPLIVRRQGNTDEFELIAGERRWRASQMAGLHEIPVVVKDVDNETALIMAIVENIQREDLNPIEEARGFSRLIDEFEMTQAQVAEVVGKSRSAVANLLRLMLLNPDVQKMIEDGSIEMGHARALLPLSKEQQLAFARKIVLKNASVREVENWVRELSGNKQNNKLKSDYIDDPNIKSLQTNLSELLGASVVINHSDSGKGKLVINYHSIDELDGIIAKIH